MKKKPKCMFEWSYVDKYGDRKFGVADEIEILQKVLVQATTECNGVKNLIVCTSGLD